MQEKVIYIISGCNGAGKTTASMTILPEFLDCQEFVNADMIASGLSPFQPEKVAFEAGRIMLERIDFLMQTNQSFAIETTLATKSYKNKLLKAIENGYQIKPRLRIRLRDETYLFNKIRHARNFLDEEICYISISKK